MAMLDPNRPVKVDNVVIEKLDNGYCVTADTKFSGNVAHYCSNLKGVTKSLWLFFEGKTRLTKIQAEGMKGVLEAQREKLDKKDENKTETNDA